MIEVKSINSLEGEDISRRRSCVCVNKKFDFVRKSPPSSLLENYMENRDEEEDNLCAVYREKEENVRH